MASGRVESCSPARATPMESKPSLMGRILFRWLPMRRRVVLENLRTAFGSVLDDARIRRAAERFYGHFWKSLVEMARLYWMSDDDIRRHMRIRGREHLEAAAAIGRGVLLLTGHFGSWEFAPVAAILAWPQYRGRFHFVRKNLDPLTERILFGRFRRAGLGVIPKRGGLQQILDALGRNDAVAFLLDQHASPGSRNGVAVEFFGRPAGTYRSLAMIAALTGAPVVPATSWREPDGSHVMEFLPALKWIHRDDPEDEIVANTRGYNRVLERFVTAHPEQWFWFHRRWKL